MCVLWAWGIIHNRNCWVLTRKGAREVSDDAELADRGLSAMGPEMRNALLTCADRAATCGVIGRRASCTTRQ